MSFLPRNKGYFHADRGSVELTTPLDTCTGYAYPEGKAKRHSDIWRLERAKSCPLNKMRLMLSPGRAARTKRVAETVPSSLPLQQGPWKVPVGVWEGAELQHILTLSLS